MKPQAIPYKRCAVIINPVSTNNKRAKRFVDQLSELFPPDRLEIVETSADHDENARMVTALAQKLDKHSVLCVAGGDGTVSSVMNILMTSSSIPAAAQLAPLLPLWGGNANDLAYMANGSTYKAQLDSILKTGSSVPIHPLAVTTQRSGKSQTRLAACYVSFGASAYAARLINRPHHRYRRIYVLFGARLMIEILSVTRSLLRAKSFSSEIDGFRTPLYDLILINGSRIAKMNRVPVSLADEHFYEIFLTKKYPYVFAYAYRLLRGFSQNQLNRTRRALKLHSVVWAQFDGEVQQIPDETEISIQMHEKPFYILSTKLGK